MVVPAEDKSVVKDKPSDKLAALQRNYETLSKVALEERTELQRLRKAEAAWQEAAEAVKAESLQQLQVKQRALEDVAARAEEDLQAAKKRAAEERGKLDAKLSAAEGRLEREKTRASAAEARAVDAERRAKLADDARTSSTPGQARGANRAATACNPRDRSIAPRPHEARPISNMHRRNGSRAGPRRRCEHREGALQEALAQVRQAHDERSRAAAEPLRPAIAAAESRLRGADEGGWAEE